ATLSATATSAASISASGSRFSDQGARVGLMAITQRLELRQGQALVMTPQLQQAIKLLQLSNLELTAYVAQELERNPLLERDEGAQNTSESAPPEEAPEENALADTALAREDF